MINVFFVMCPWLVLKTHFNYYIDSSALALPLSLACSPLSLSLLLSVIKLHLKRAYITNDQVKLICNMCTYIMTETVSAVVHFDDNKRKHETLSVSIMHCVCVSEYVCNRKVMLIVMTSDDNNIRFYEISKLTTQWTFFKNSKLKTKLCRGISFE